MATILVARHGQTDWNAEHRWQGHADRSLNARGREQAAALAERLADTELAAVYSSDLRRAVETATVVAERQGLEVRTVPELREVDVGSWSGLTQAEAEERYPDGFHRWRNGLPGWDDGETYEAMKTRVVAAILAIAAEDPEGPVLVVAHGGPIRAIHAAALGLDVQTYRRMRPVEPNARLSAVCVVDGELTELCHASEIDELVARDRLERAEAAARAPAPDPAA